MKKWDINFMQNDKETTEYFLGLLTNLLEQSQKTSEGKIQSIMNIIELKDSYTKDHSERVAKYAIIFAKQTQKYTEATLHKFYYSCLLHDIGKLGISNEILNKPVPLTNNEYTKMKTHSTLGLEFIKDFSLIEGYESVICSHHEKWDGSGYPSGLKNYEIPLGARIVSIADTFDAMTSTRPYRSALSPEEAYKQIIEGSGTQFEPKLVEVFKVIYPLWFELLEDFSALEVKLKNNK